MALFQARAECDAAPARVWAELLDWEGSSGWIEPPTTVEVIGSQRIGIGARLRAVTTIARVLRLVDYMSVTDWTDEREIRVRHVGWMLKGDGIFRVEPTSTGSRFTWIEDLPLPLGVVGELLGRLFRPVFERYLRRSCENLTRRASAR